MTREQKTAWKRLTAWCGLVAVALLLVITHVNTMDNIQHLTASHDHEHSILSMVEDDHGAVHDDHQKPDDEGGKFHHCHPNLCGVFTLDPQRLAESDALFGTKIDLSWSPYDVAPSAVYDAHERPPKASSANV